MGRVFFYFLALGWFARPSRASEYKLCATAEHEAFCKWIEASRNEVSCVEVSDSVDCLLKMQRGEAELGTFYPEETFLAARFLGDEGVVLADVRHPDRADEDFAFETVVVVRKTMLGGLSALAGANYCHPGFSKAQYWSDRVLKAFEKKVLEQFKDEVGCDSSTRSAFEDDLHRLSQIFGKACRPGTWAVTDWWDKKLKRQYHTLCDQCEHPTTCSYKVQNKGRHSDALRCLTLGGGNVTYTALEFVREYFDLDSEEDLHKPTHKRPFLYNFLCPDGSTRPLTASKPCSWIKQPWTSIIALNSTAPDILKNLKEWLERENRLAWTNNLRTILTKGNGVLKFREPPLLVSEFIKEGRDIPTSDEDSCRPSVKWCTIGRTETRKCEFISTAALTHGLPTRLRCIEGTSKTDCLAKVRSRHADVVYVDAELGFISRKVFNLTAAAYLETQRTANYYGVLVLKGESVRTLQDLRGKRACFPQYNGMGWLTYVQALKSLSIIPRHSYSTSKLWSFFSQVCAPGANDPNVNPHSAGAPDRLCKGCFRSNSEGSCEVSPRNPYFGEVGALRCLHNGDGDVAFLDFHAARKYLGRENTIKMEDFKVLCRDGSLEKFNSTNPDKCSFTQVNGGEVVTRNDLGAVEKTDIHNTLMELDDLFGISSRSYNPALKMFESFDGHPDVLFKDSAVSLVSVYETHNRFVNNYIEILAESEDSKSSVLLPRVSVLAFSVFFILLG